MNWDGLPVWIKTLQKDPLGARAFPHFSLVVFPSSLAWCSLKFVRVTDPTESHLKATQWVPAPWKSFSQSPAGVVGDRGGCWVISICFAPAFSLHVSPLEKPTPRPPRLFYMLFSGEGRSTGDLWRTPCSSSQQLLSRVLKFCKYKGRDVRSQGKLLRMPWPRCPFMQRQK